ncbi:MAG: LPS export ABC transporter periplasmic protein LptC, partial [Desulfobulbaceae bacterium]|nr:LPS export ABC transporter periplasmic protein LptC [Desulfobulbaceae bacterium]
TVKHRKGAVLQTEQLTFLDAVDRFKTDTVVRMVSDGMEIRGKGFEYDLKGRWYRVDGRVNVDVK